MTKADHLRSLARLCRHLGGQLVRVSEPHFYRLFDAASQEDPMTVSESPFTSGHGIHWQRKIIFAVRGYEEIDAIIHEMGHVFADPHHPDADKCHEFAWFGWEIAVARLIGAGRSWSRGNSNYAVADNGETWQQLSVQQRRAVARERLAHAQQIGVVTSDGMPRSIR